jgi:hypothetical protein
MSCICQQNRLLLINADAPASPTTDRPSGRQRTLDDSMVETPVPQEVKLRFPNDFNRDSKSVRGFLADCELFFKVNAEKYDSDMKKIIFALSFMQEGSAGPWKEVFISRQAHAINWGTWNEFKAELLRSFQPTDVEGQAMTDLFTIKQSYSPGHDIDHYNTEFCHKLAESRIGNEKVAIQCYLRGLDFGLYMAIANTGKLPETLNVLMDLTATVHKQRATVRNLAEQYRNKVKVNPRPSAARTRFIDTVQADSDPEDEKPREINRLSEKERKRRIEGNLCFKCGKAGHISRNCRSKASSGSEGRSQPRKEKKAPSFEEMKRQLRMLTVEEKVDLLESLEAQDF